LKLVWLCGFAIPKTDIHTAIFPNCLTITTSVLTFSVFSHTYRKRSLCSSFREPMAIGKDHCVSLLAPPDSSLPGNRVGQCRSLLRTAHTMSHGSIIFSYHPRWRSMSSLVLLSWYYHPLFYSLLILSIVNSQN
jgi:hypothetical protein